MKVKLEAIGDILTELYRSEISLAIGSLYDGGIEYSLENRPYTLSEGYKDIAYTGNSDMGDVFGFIVKDAVEKFPDSAFAKWVELGKDRIFV